MTQTVGLERVDCLSVAVRRLGVGFDAFGDGVAQLAGACGDIGIIQNLTAEDAFQIAHHHCGEHVRGHQIVVGAGVVAGAEAGPGHAGVRHRQPLATVAQRFGGNVRVADEEIRGVLVMLFGLEDVKNLLDAGNEFVIEMIGVAGVRIQHPSQLNGVAQRVHLVLALPKPGTGEVGLIILVPRSAVRLLVEGVRIRVDGDVAELLPHQTGDQARNVAVFGGKGQIRAQLCGRITQPHGRDIAGEQECGAVVMPFDRGGQGVGKAGVEVLGPGGVFGAAPVRDVLHEIRDRLRYRGGRHNSTSLFEGYTYQGNSIILNRFS